MSTGPGWNPEQQYPPQPQGYRQPQHQHPPQYGQPQPPFPGGPAPQGYYQPPPPKRPWYKKKRWIIPLGLVAVLVVASAAGGASEGGGDGNTSSQSLADTPGAGGDGGNSGGDAPAKPAKATQQDKFLALIDKARNEAGEGDNAFQKRLPLTNRNKAICKLLKSKTIKNWKGTVNSLDTNGEGLGVLEIEIGEDVKVATWNNALSDITADSLIKPSSPLFEKMGTMNEGDAVTFSGRFIPEDASCIQEQSITDNGSTKTPTFTMKFSALK